MEVVHYLTETGSDVYQSWVDNIRDARAKSIILRRIDRAATGSYGDCKPCRDGVRELRIDQGPGYRVYFFVYGSQMVILLCGGDKRTQDADIKKAVAFKTDFLKRMKEGAYE